MIDGRPSGRRRRRRPCRSSDLGDGLVPGWSSNAPGSESANAISRERRSATDARRVRRERGGPHRLLGLELRALARARLRPSAREPLARALRRALRHGRGQRDLLPASLAERGRRAGSPPTPDGFRFAVKASRYLTHLRRLRDLGPGLERFLERIEPLVRSPKLGPILWQLPPRLSSRRRAAGRCACPVSPARARDRVPARELVRRRRLRAAARARRRARDRRCAEPPVPDGRAHDRLGVRALPPRPSRPARQLLGRELEGWADRIRRWPVERGLARTSTTTGRGSR